MNKTLHRRLTRLEAIQQPIQNPAPIWTSTNGIGPTPAEREAFMAKHSGQPVIFLTLKKSQRDD